MKIAVVALGKIGLPLAVQFARSGAEVIGADVSQAVVDAVNAGTEPFPGEAHLGEYLAETARSGALRASTDTTAAVAESDVVVVVVPLFVEFRERSSLFDRRHVFALSNDHSRLLHDYVCFELSDVCCGHLFGTGRIKMHAGSPRR